MLKDYNQAILDYNRVLDVQPGNKAAALMRDRCEARVIIRRTKRDASIYKAGFEPWGFRNVRN